MFAFTDTVVSFDQLAYSVTEGDIVVQPVLHISNPLPYHFSVSVFVIDGSATAELLSSLYNIYQYFADREQCTHIRPGWHLW